MKGSTNRIDRYNTHYSNEHFFFSLPWWHPKWSQRWASFSFLPCFFPAIQAGLFVVRFEANAKSGQFSSRFLYSAAVLYVCRFSSCFLCISSSNILQLQGSSQHLIYYPHALRKVLEYDKVSSVTSRTLCMKPKVLKWKKKSVCLR